MSINAGLLISDMKANLTDIWVPQVLPVTGKAYLFSRNLFSRIKRLVFSSESGHKVPLERS
jgi:hypothetical protein